MQTIVNSCLLAAEEFAERCTRRSAARRQLFEDLEAGRKCQWFLLEVARTIESEARANGCWATYADLISDIRRFAPLDDVLQVADASLQRRAANALNQLWECEL